MASETYALSLIEDEKSSEWKVELDGELVGVVYAWSEKDPNKWSYRTVKGGGPPSKDGGFYGSLAPYRSRVEAAWSMVANNV
jgi:hypothetical protein